MAIPDYQSIMLPLLRYLSDNKEHSLRESIEVLSKEFGLKEDEKKDLLPSGRQPTFDNRVSWARTYMKKAGLVKSTRRGYFCITERGQDILKKNLQNINVHILEQFPEFVEFKSIRRDTAPGKKDIEPETRETPEESLESAYQKIRQDLVAEILQNIKNCSPNFFERLVVDVLVKIGYGGSRQEAGKAIGQSGDGGVDGIIKEDRLGLDIIYIQAKRWESTVGRPEIQKFAGALQGQRAKKGVFLTTSNFSKDALDYADRIDNKIVLIDGISLANLMIDHNVGVSSVANYEIKRIDFDYFAEE